MAFISLLENKELSTSSSPESCTKKEKKVPFYLFRLIYWHSIIILLFLSNQENKNAKRNGRFRNQQLLEVCSSLFKNLSMQNKRHIIKNMAYVLHDVATYSKESILELILSVLSKVGNALLGAIITYIVVDNLTKGNSPTSYLSLIAILCSVSLIITCIEFGPTPVIVGFLLLRVVAPVG